MLQAAADLCREQGFENVTVEGIAAKAHVSKQTVYRWWKSKADILFEALISDYVSFSVPLPENSGNLKSDLSCWAKTIGEDRHAGGETRHLFHTVMSALLADEDQAKPVYAQLIAPVRRAIKARFLAEAETLRESGKELRGDPELLADLFMSSLMSRLILGETVEEDWIEQVLEFVASHRED